MRQFLKRSIAIIVCVAMVLMLINVNPPLNASGATEGRIIYTANTNGNNSTSGDGSIDNPYNLFADALASANDGDTIYILAPRGFINSSDNSPFIIDKSVTITGDGATLMVRTGGIVLEADVTFDNIVLSFGNRYHDAICANGHTLTLNNVSCEDGARQIDLFAGGMYEAGESVSDNIGDDGQIVITGGGSNFGNIYAGSMNGDFNGDVTISVKDMSGAVDGDIYVSGAVESDVNVDDFFNLEEPAAPVANDEYTISGNVDIDISGSSTKLIQQISDASSTTTTVVVDTDGEREGMLKILGVDCVVVDGGGIFAPVGLSNTTDVELRDSSVLDLSLTNNYEGDNSDIELDSLVAIGDGNGIILGKQQCLTVTSLLTGTFNFATENGYAGNSGIAEYDFTYIKSKADSDATFLFEVYPGQEMSLEEVGQLVVGDITYNTSWKTTELPDWTFPTLSIENIEVMNPILVITQSEIAGKNGLYQLPFNIEITWPEGYSEEDCYLYDVPFQYEVTYGESTYTAQIVNDNGYEAHIPELHISFWHSSDYENPTIGEIVPAIYLGNTGNEPIIPAVGTYEIAIIPNCSGEQIIKNVKLVIIEDAVDTPTSGVEDTFTVVTVAPEEGVMDTQVSISADIKHGDDSSALDGQTQLYINGVKYVQSLYTVDGSVTYTLPATVENGFCIGSNEITIVYVGDSDTGAGIASGLSQGTATLLLEAESAQIGYVGVEQTYVYNGCEVQYDISGVDIVNGAGDILKEVEEFTLHYELNGIETTPILPGEYDVVASLNDVTYGQLTGKIASLKILASTPQVSVSTIDIGKTKYIQAKVTGVDEVVNPVGTIGFYKDDVLCGTGNLTYGECLLDISSLSEGTYVFYAQYTPVYSPVSPYSKANSSQLTVVIASDAVAVTGISISDNATVSVGGQIILSATVLPQTATNKNISWVSQATDIAKVSSDGVVTGISVGETYIIATTADGGYMDMCLVTVTESGSGASAPTHIELDKSSLTLTLGETATRLVATTTPVGALVEWISSDSSIVAVDQNGNVTQMGVGTATVTARTVVGGLYASCTVTVEASKVINVTGVTLNQRELTLSIGGEATLVATVTPADATNAKVTWSSSNDNVVTVDSSGGISAIAEGEATITATTQDGNYTATCKVIVENDEVQSSSESPSTSEVVSSETTTQETTTQETTTQETTTQETTTQETSSQETASETEKESTGESSSESESTTSKEMSAKDGWGIIADKLKNVVAGNTITIEMDGISLVPNYIIKEIAGKDVTLVFKVDEIVFWSVNGKNVVADKVVPIEVEYKLNEDIVSQDVIDTIISDGDVIQLHLKHEGLFAANMKLNMLMDAEYVGKWANLYYYNPLTDSLSIEASCKISGDGVATWMFTHASDYVIYVDNVNHATNSDEQESTQPVSSEDITSESKDSGDGVVTADASNIIFVLMLLFLTVAVFLGTRFVNFKNE